MNIATLGVAIDPTGATSGAAAAVKALEQLTTAARSAAAAMNATGKAAGATAAGAGEKTAAAHQGVLSKMAASLKGFFSSTGASAQQTQGIFSGMVGHIVSFLQSVLSMVPGATGAFAGMASAAGSAATSLAGVAGGGLMAMAVLAPIVVVLVALAAAFVGLGIAGVLAWKAINAAAQFEQTEVQYTVLIGNVKKTQKTIAELRAFADVTPFDTKGVMQWGQEMLNAGIKAEDLVSTMHDVGNSALGDANKMSTAVLVLTQAIGKMKIDTMDLRQLGSAGIPIMEGLSKSMGKTTAQVLKLVEDGKVGFTELRAAFANLGGEGGRLSSMMDKMSETWEGRVSTIKSRWDNLLVAFGTPLKDALSPMLVKLDAMLKAMIPTAERMGQAVAGAIIGEDWDEVWKFVTLKAAVAWKKMADAFKEYMKQIGAEIWAEWRSQVDSILQMLGAAPADKVAPKGTLEKQAAQGHNLTAGGYHPRQVPVKDAGLDMTGVFSPSDSKDPEAMANAIWEKWVQRGKNAPKAVTWEDLQEPNRPDITSGAGLEEDKFKGDAHIMEELAKELKQMNALLGEGKMTDREFGRRETMLKDKAATELADPNKYQKDLELWRTSQAEKARVSEATEARIKSGQASTSESFIAGINKAAAAWGNTSQQMQKLGEGVANSLSTNISGALTAIITGTKDAKTAFRDMAVAILNDIAKMIIQMLVEMAIQAALNALRGAAGGMFKGGQVGGSGSGQFGSTASQASSGLGDQAAPAYLAGGGPVWGGQGGIDDIPAMLTRGEYVIPRDAADHYGKRWLDQVRDKRVARYASGGGVGPIPTAGVAKPGAHTAGDQYHFSISVDARGESDDVTGGGTQAQKRQKGERLARQIEQITRQVIRDEQRTGGTLSHR